MTRKQSKTTIAELKELLTQDKDFLRPMLAEIVQQVLKLRWMKQLGPERSLSYITPEKTMGNILIRNCRT